MFDSTATRARLPTFRTRCKNLHVVPMRTTSLLGLFLKYNIFLKGIGFPSSNVILAFAQRRD